MSISAKIEATIEHWTTLWKERLRGWVASALLSGVERTFAFFEPEWINDVRTTLEQMRDNPEIPPELKSVLDRMLTPGGKAPIPAIVWIIIALFGGMAGAQLAPSFKKIGYFVSRTARDYRLDPLQVITAWRRDPIAYETYFDDLRDQGWSEERLEALKFFTLYYPSPGDLVHWQAREVFEEEMVTKYGLDDELELIEKGPFYKAGMTDEQIRNFWRAHWEHASFMQVVEMLHRGLITEEDMWEWFRVVEIPPFWRKMLIQIAYTWPTRVDVRRWWDMRTIDEARLRELYSGMGYRGKNLDDYVLWTKVYVAFPDLMARWSKGWINLDDVRRELTDLGMPAERLEEFIQMKVKATEAERTAPERDLTKTDITSGVKKEVITRDEGVELLMDLGYEEDEAVFILATKVPIEEQASVVKDRELTKADILKGLKTAIITEAEAITKLGELRYRPDDAEFIVKIFMASVKPPVEPRDREASKADIVLAVKKGLITPEEAYLMLQDIGYSPEASNFILTVRAESSPFSPVSYEEFKDRTTKYKRAAGREARPMTDELKQAGAEVVKLTNELESLKRSVTEEEAKLVAEEPRPAKAEAKLKKLQVASHRAEAKLDQAKTEYNKLLAEWRHGG